MYFPANYIAVPLVKRLPFSYRIAQFSYITLLPYLLMWLIIFGIYISSLLLCRVYDVIIIYCIKNYTYFTKSTYTDRGTLFNSTINLSFKVSEPNNFTCDSDSPKKHFLWETESETFLNPEPCNQPKPP
jgi:hypothetical protein